MNPLWAFFFKDKYRTIFSVYKMSLAELLFGLLLLSGVAYGVKVGVEYIIDFEETTSVLDE